MKLKQIQSYAAGLWDQVEPEWMIWACISEDLWAPREIADHVEQRLSLLSWLYSFLSR